MQKRLLSLSLGAFVAAGPAWSATVESIGGNYTGKVVDASQVTSSKGDSCEVSVDPKAKGNTVRFQLNGEQPAYVERDKVETGLASGMQKVEVQTGARKGGNVTVVLKLGGEKLKFVRLRVKGHKKNWTIACGNLMAQ